MATKKRPLGDWKNAPKRYLRDSDDPQVRRLIDAAAAGELLDIVYLGGSQPGTSRQILPRAVYFAIDFGYYVEAYDYRRQGNRTFRVDRIQGLAGQPASRRTVRPRRSQEPQPAPSTARPKAGSVAPHLEQLKKEKSGFSPVWYWIAGIILLFIIFA